MYRNVNVPTVSFLAIFKGAASVVNNVKRQLSFCFSLSETEFCLMSLSCVHSAGFRPSAVVGYTVHFTGLCLHHSFGRLVHCLSTPQEESQA